MEKIRSIPVEEDKITEIVHEYGPVKIYSSEETDAVMERLTLRDMAELSVGGGMTGSRFFEAPGAAGVTCTTLEQKGIPNVVMADGPAGLRLNKVSSVSFTGKVKGIEPNISCMKYLPEPVKKSCLEIRIARICSISLLRHSQAGFHWHRAGIWNWRKKWEMQLEKRWNVMV